jgi:flagellar protein FlaG
MESREDTMSDVIQSVGTQALNQAATVYPAAASTPSATQGQASATASTGAATAAPASSPESTTTPADQLDLSPSAGISGSLPSPSLSMEEAAKAYQDYLANLPSDLEFQPNSQAGIVVFRVVNPVTQKVIRQLPPEQVVQQAIALRNADKQNHSGILFDESH